MVDVGLGVGVASLVLIIGLLWRIWVVEQTLHDRVDDIDRSLGHVVGMLVEKLDEMANRAVSITENPLGQIFEFVKQMNPNNQTINKHQPRADSGQFIEVEQNAPKKEKEKPST